ncbi:MAG: phage portal protein [Sphingomonadaceae bacterium]
MTFAAPEALTAYLRGMLDGTGQGALRVGAVYRAVSLISGAVSSMPCHVKRRQGGARVDAEDHWSWDLLTRRPNGWQTPQQWRRMLMTHLLLRGNAYCLKVGTPSRISALVPLMPDRMAVRQRDDLAIEYRYTRADGRQVDLAQGEVMHFVGLSLDGVTGVSVLAAAHATMAQALAVQRHGVSVFENATRIGGVLTHPGHLGGEALENLRRTLNAFRGADNAGGSLILEEGMKFEPIAMTMQDAQFVETAKLTRSEIYQFFGVPAPLAAAGDSPGGAAANIEALGAMFVTYTLNDWLVTLEETIARDLFRAPSDRNLFVRFNRNSLVRGDIAARFQAYAVQRQWGLATINEIRGLEDMNPIEGGDSLFAAGNAQRAAEDNRDDAA